MYKRQTLPQTRERYESKHVQILHPARAVYGVLADFNHLTPVEGDKVEGLCLIHILAKYFSMPASEIKNCRTYGGHGEQMAVFASTTELHGKKLSELIGTQIPAGDWEALRQRVIQGGKHIIDLRGRSSFQSPAYLSIEMIAAAMGGEAFRWPAGVYVHSEGFNHIMMAMDTSITKDGVH